MASKYWVANNPNSEVTDAEAQKVEELSATTVSVDELNQLDASVNFSGLLLTSAAVAAKCSHIRILHNTTPVLVTGPDGTRQAGKIMVIGNVSTGGTAAHTVTLAGGTFDGTNNTATLNAPGESLCVMFDTSGHGTVIANIGSVGLSSV
jgi:hypothetical protein